MGAWKQLLEITKIKANSNTTEKKASTWESKYIKKLKLKIHNF